MKSLDPEVSAPTSSPRATIEKWRSHVRHQSGNLKIVAWPAFRFKDWNPYQFLLYTHMQGKGARVIDATLGTLLSGAHDVLHVHWPDHILNTSSFVKAALKSAAFVLAVCLLKLRGAKIVWTVHNLVPHESGHPLLARALWWWFPRLLDGFITMTDEAVPATHKLFPSLQGKASAVIPHGHYRGYYKNHLSRADARKTLGIPLDATVILFFGMIRPYKNLMSLIHAFREIEKDGVRLVIAGDLPQHLRNTPSAAQIYEAVSHDGRILFHPKHIEDDDIQAYFNACDIVVLPYASVLNSGAAILALSFNKPVLLPNMGAMPALQRVAGKEWVHIYSGELRAEDIEKYLTTTKHLVARSPTLDALDWNSIAERTYHFLVSLSIGANRQA